MCIFDILKTLTLGRKLRLYNTTNQCACDLHCKFNNINNKNDNECTSFTFPLSITNTTSSIVTLVSAMLVERICS